MDKEDSEQVDSQGFPVLVLHAPKEFNDVQTQSETKAEHAGIDEQTQMEADLNEGKNSDDFTEIGGAKATGGESDAEYDDDDFEDEEVFQTPASELSREIFQGTTDVFTPSFQEALNTSDSSQTTGEGVDENENPFKIPTTPLQLTKAEIISVNAVNNMKRDPLYAAGILVSSGQLGIIDTVLVLLQEDSTSLKCKEELLNNLFQEVVLPTKPELTGVNSTHPSFLDGVEEGWTTHHYIDALVSEIKKIREEDSWSDSDLNAPTQESAGKVVTDENANNVEISGSDPSLDSAALEREITSVPLPSYSLIQGTTTNEDEEIVAETEEEEGTPFVSTILNYFGVNTDDEVNSDGNSNKSGVNKTVVNCLAGVQGQIPESRIGTYDLDAILAETESKRHGLNEEEESVDKLALPSVSYLLEPNRPESPNMGNSSDSEEETCSKVEESDDVNGNQENKPTGAQEEQAVADEEVPPQNEVKDQASSTEGLTYEFQTASAEGLAYEFLNEESPTEGGAVAQVEDESTLTFATGEEIAAVFSPLFADLTGQSGEGASSEVTWLAANTQAPSLEIEVGEGAKGISIVTAYEEILARNAAQEEGTSNKFKYEGYSMLDAIAADRSDVEPEEEEAPEPEPVPVPIPEVTTATIPTTLPPTPSVKVKRPAPLPRVAFLKPRSNYNNDGNQPGPSTSGSFGKSAQSKSLVNPRLSRSVSIGPVKKLGKGKSGPVPSLGKSEQSVSTPTSDPSKQRTRIRSTSLSAPQPKTQIRPIIQPTTANTGYVQRRKASGSADQRRPSTSTAVTAALAGRGKKPSTAQSKRKPVWK